MNIPELQTHPMGEVDTEGLLSSGCLGKGVRILGDSELERTSNLVHVHPHSGTFLERKKKALCFAIYPKP